MIALSPVSKSEAARYMGVKGAPDENISAILDRCEEEVRKKLRPNYVYREAQVEFTSEGVQLSDMTVPLTGEDIRRHLQGCTRAVVFAATVSGEADKLIRQAEVRNMAEALRENGILLRACGEMPGLDEGWVRTAVRTEAENTVLLAALEEVLTHG